MHKILTRTPEHFPLYSPFVFILISIIVSQFIVHRCEECGQPLPESYQPPADEDWSTGIFGFAEDPESCKTVCFSIIKLKHIP